MKIIYVIEDMHIYNYDYKRFQMKYFDKGDNEIEAWSAVRWTFKECDDPINISKANNVYYIDNFNDLIKQFERIKSDNCLFLCYPYHSYTYTSYCIRKMIKKYGFSFCNISGSPAIGKQRLITTTNIISLIILQVVRLFKHILYAIIKFDKNILFNGLIGIIGPCLYASKYNFVTTRLANAGFPNWVELSNRNKNIMIHSESYDEFLDANVSNDEFLKLKEEYNLPDKYALLVDDFEIGHSDFKKLGENIPVTNVEEHLRKVNKLLSMVENKFGIPVVIAQHPKAEYKFDAFEGRVSIKNHTNALLKNSSLVIIGISTCIGLLVLYKKDFIGWYNSEYFKNVPRCKSSYDLVQSIFNCKYIDVNNIQCENSINKYINHYDKDIYNNYLHRYIVEKDGMCGKHFYEIVADIVLNSDQRFN